MSHVIIIGVGGAGANVIQRLEMLLTSGYIAEPKITVILPEPNIAFVDSETPMLKSVPSMAMIAMLENVESEARNRISLLRETTFKSFLQGGNEMRSFGIDLGTTYSCVAYFNDKSNAEAIKNTEEKSIILPHIAKLTSKIKVCSVNTCRRMALPAINTKKQKLPNAVISRPSMARLVVLEDTEVLVARKLTEIKLTLATLLSHRKQERLLLPLVNSMVAMKEVLTSKGRNAMRSQVISETKLDYCTSTLNGMLKRSVISAEKQKMPIVAIDEIPMVAHEGTVVLAESKSLFSKSALMTPRIHRKKKRLSQQAIYTMTEMEEVLISDGKNATWSQMISETKRDYRKKKIMWREQLSTVPQLAA